MKRLILLLFVLSLVSLSGCASSGEVTKLRLYDVMHSTLENAGGNLSVAVSGFEDKRPPAQHLGSHYCFFGGVNHFDLMDGNLSDGLSTAFVNFLNKSGFKASGKNSGPADVRITGKVTKFTANAKGQFLSTNINVDAIMEFTISNVADGSTVRMTIGAGGSDDVIFFGPEDLENLVNEVLQEGFEELVEKTSVQGKTLRRKV
ncbi:hypothetical protein [Candidatus Nitronereus thalassa]|uniref:Lipoprotein n=1 Tax=Candidatus Nitronereus thalassa TaxID=3020898 RepID=A0ABU3K467_9BACT|nr:hypothetical protein [Candidatus Nitronereus thalassa]MDT7041165.1 hypothetical protein [Candidatus Nitronereus thalassa]